MQVAEARYPSIESNDYSRLLSETRPLLQLETEIPYYRENFRSEGLPSNWADLPGTGFMIKPQMELYRRETKSRFLNQTEQDVKGFVLEYLAEGLTFPIYYSIEKVEGRDRVVAPLYGGKLMVDTTTDQERKGSVKKTLSQKIEPFLLNASEGSIAVMTSPDGWSGLTTDSGDPIIFPDSQTYILQKRGNQIVGFTMRTDFNKSEHARVINSLGGEEISHDAPDEDFVSNVVFIDGSTNTTIEDVVLKMVKARKEVSNSAFAYKRRLWDEAFADISRRDDLWRFDEKTRGFFQEFRDYVIKTNPSEPDVKDALALTVLKISKYIRGGKDRVKSDVLYRSNMGMGAVLEDVQSLPGCAGGGERPSLIEGITPRISYTMEQILKGEKYEFDKKGECVDCGVSSDELGPCYLCKTCDVGAKIRNSYLPK